MKVAVIVATILFAIAAILAIIDTRGVMTRVVLCLTALGLAALSVAHWPGLKP